MTWWTFDGAEGIGGVLELDSPALELHWRLVEGRTVAWWQDERGRWLGLARVGVA